jgi:YD repeat-containing protein
MINFIFPDWEYFGPGTDLKKAGKPISELDRLARTHDYAYDDANRMGGRRGRVEKTKADYAMAFDTTNPFVAVGLFTQATVRVFTFNMVDLPW